MKAFGFLLLLLLVGASEGRLTFGGKLARILEGKAEHSSPQHRQLPGNKNKDKNRERDVKEYCVEKGKDAKNGYHVKKYSGKPKVKTFPMEICTTKTPKCLKKEKNGKVEYVVKLLNYTPKKAVDMSFCEQDSEEDSTDEDEEDSGEDEEDSTDEDEEDSGEDGDPYCIDAGDGTYTLEYYADPPAGALEPGDKVGDKVLSDLCDLEGGGEVTGDPHFVMWSGQKFDFHGGCDMVLVQNPDFNNGQGLYIHIRTKIVRWWSYVESAVVQIGDDSLEVMGGVAAKRFFVNGERGTPLRVNGMMPFTIGGHAVRYRNLGPNMFQFKIFLPNDQTVVFKAVKDFMRVDVEQPSLNDFHSSVGLMGSFENGQMVGRDASTIFTDENEFGLEWQVTQDEPMLFHNIEGVQHPETCSMPTLPQDSRRLEEGTISREDAEVACSKGQVSTDDFEDCVSDVMATNDPDMVGAF